MTRMLLPRDYPWSRTRYPYYNTLKYRLDIEKAVRSKASDIYKEETLEECRTFII
jgi:ssDNA-binding replication factor A large subunit